MNKKHAQKTDGESRSIKPATTGLPDLDRLVGGIFWGDNIVLEVNSGAPVDKFMSSFISANDRNKTPLVYVSFNRSPQTIMAKYADPYEGRRFMLIDCFSSGKGNNDDVFMDFFKDQTIAPESRSSCDPSDPAHLQQALLDICSKPLKKPIIFSTV